MNLGLENTLLEAAAHLCELAALKRNHIWSKYSAVTCAIYSVGYALPEVSEKDRRSGTNTLCSPQQCIVVQYKNKYINRTNVARRKL